MRRALVIRQPAAAQQLFLLFHGYGANAADLEPLGTRLAAEFPQAAVVSLEAPEPMGYPGGYQWYSSDALDDSKRASRVAAALPAFRAEIASWQQATGVGPPATALVGFSQGAVMSLEACVVDPAPAGRVVAIAGRFASLPAGAPATTTFHLLHGKADDVIPCGHTVEGAQQLLALGADATADVLPFVGHTIDDEMIAVALRRLRTYVPRRIWEEAMK